MSWLGHAYRGYLLCRSKKDLSFTVSNWVPIAWVSIANMFHHHEQQASLSYQRGIRNSLWD